MCTVTFSPTPGGYLLGMNRDEQRSREPGLRPTIVRPRGVELLHPREPGGGTWIGVNRHGVTLALLNWYSVPDRSAPGRPRRSRGEVILNAGDGDTVDAVMNRMRARSFAGMKPFRLVGVFPAGRSVREWRWDGATLTSARHPWKLQCWISSGHEEVTAQKVRGRLFAGRSRQRTAGTRAWMRRFHGSHASGPGPNSVCMHRLDAATVSYTEVEVDGERRTMLYHGAPLCEMGCLVGAAMNLGMLE